MSSFWQSAPSTICVDVTLIHKGKYTFVWQAATLVGQRRFMLLGCMLGLKIKSIS